MQTGHCSLYDGFSEDIFNVMEKSIKDTRHHRRFDVEAMDIRGTLNASDAASKPFRVTVLSLGGLLIEAAHNCDSGSELRMELALPGKVRLSCLGKVTRCFPSEGGPPGVNRIGLKFTSMSEQDRKGLKDFVRWLYLKDAGFTD